MFNKFIFLILLLSQTGFSAVYITIQGGQVRRAKIAVGQIHRLPEAAGADPILTKKVRDLLLIDLEFSNIFDFISDPAFAPFDTSEISNLKYDEVGNLGAAFALRMAHSMSGGKLTVEAVLFDVTGKKQIFNRKYSYSSSQYQKLVHTVAEDILKELTGEHGLFLSRIAMICWDKRRKSPPKEVYIVDSDGSNLLQITHDNTLSVSPAWSPDGKYLSYTQYEWRLYGRIRKKGTALKRHDLANGERIVLSAKEGMNSGVAWSPDGTRIITTLSYTGHPELYSLSPLGGSEPEPFSRNIQWKRISGEGFQPTAESQLFDVEPSFSPDGKHLVISSARTGHPMIYTVDMSTRIATQLTFAGQYNATPAWSPRGDKIIFSAQRTGDGNFDLYLIDPDGNNLQRVTNGERMGKRINSEDASWAPTGRHIAFSNSEGGAYAVYTMALDGGSKRRISPLDKECKTPTWGPPEY